MGGLKSGKYTGRGKRYDVRVRLVEADRTRPEDLNHFTWRDWLQSAAEGLERLSQVERRIAIIGFSMGGLLAAQHSRGENQERQGRCREEIFHDGKGWMVIFWWAHRLPPGDRPAERQNESRD